MLFFGKLAVLCFLETPVLRFPPFALLPTKYHVENEIGRLVLGISLSQYPEKDTKHFKLNTE